MTGWIVLIVQALGGWLASRNFLALTELREAAGPPMALTSGEVSIVVPARDEAGRLPELLQSLKALQGVRPEILVVDDGSADNTAAVATEAGAQVVRIDGPPAGWTGKSYACHVGSQVTHGDWILFTDADTVHGPDSLDLSLRAAKRHQAGLVSLLPRHRCGSFWERLLLPYAHALYFVGARNANRPHGPSIANGQYMLFRRDEYQRIGGHESVRGSLIEDVSLARLANGSGVGMLLLRAEDHLTVRMYESLPSLWEGLSKNAFRFVCASPIGGAKTVVTAIAFGASIPAGLRTRSTLLRITLFGAPALALAPWMHRFGVSRAYALLHPLGAGIFQLLALDSIRRTVLDGGTSWKGRRY